jgi:hypothetical protein
MQITLPDGTEVFTHDLSQDHVDKVVRKWVDDHSDEYELPPLHVDVIKAARDKFDGFGNVIHRAGDIIGSSAYEEASTGKKRPQCKFELLDMPEAKYRELRPYAALLTCKVAA